jgi:hypothetical protein
MKNAILSLGVLLLTTFAVDTVKAQETPMGGAAIEFEKEVHDYGTMEQHGDGTCEFVFTNTGTAPLIISNAKGSCGCTVPSWPKDPIKPGASSSIKVKYDTKRIGPINKSVTITSNATEEPTKVIRIKGTITAAGSGTPVKESSGPVAK